MKKFLLLSSVLLFVLAACGSGLNEAEARKVATAAALGTPPPPKYQTAAAIYLNLTLTPTPAPPSVMDYAGTMAAYEMLQMMTQQANEVALEREKQAQDAALERERIAAEQRAEAAKATAAAAEKTSEAINAIRTAQKEEEHQAATAVANATATQNALIFIQQTQQAHSVETQQAYVVETQQALQTAAVQPTHAVMTTTAQSYEDRIKEAQAYNAELAVKRQKMKNGLDAYGPWLLVVFVVVVTSDGFKKWLKTRVFKRDEHGKAPVVVFEKGDGTTAIVKTDAMTGAAMTIDKDGKFDTPTPPDRDEQKDVTRRLQAIEAISFLPAPYAAQAVKTMNTEFGVPRGAPNIKINDKAMGVVIDEAESQLLEDNL